MNMKFLTKTVALMLIGMVSTTLVACLGDDNNDEYNEYLITAEEYGPLLRLMEGSYQSMLYFNNEAIATENKLDSAAVSSRFVGAGDSTITVSGIPAKCLARLMKNEAAKAAVEQADNQTIKAKFYLYQKYMERTYYAVVPQPLTIDVNYDGADHKVVFFLAQMNTNYGVYAQDETVFEFRVYNIYIDDKTDVSLYYPTDVNSVLRIHAWKLTS